jgi:ribosomal protein S3
MTRKKNTVFQNICNNKSWLSSWYVSRKEYYIMLQEDLMSIVYIRSIISKTKNCSFIGVRIYKYNDVLVIDIYFVFIVFLIKKYFIRFIEDLSVFLKKNVCFALNRLSFLNIFASGFYIAFAIVSLIEKRVRFRSKVIKVLLKRIKEYCLGIYVQCKGRINNTSIARSDKLYLGSVSLNTINSSISYGLVIANTVKGLQSIKVWIYNY